MRHFPGEEKARRYATDPEYRASLDTGKAWDNHTNGITLLDPLIKAFRQQRRLSAIGTLNEALHELPPQIAKRIIADRPFSRSQGRELPSSRAVADVRFGVPFVHSRQSDYGQSFAFGMPAELGSFRFPHGYQVSDFNH